MRPQASDISGDTVRRPPGPPPIVWAMTAVFAAFEGAFALADSGVIDLGDLRWEVYKKLAFFDLYFDRLPTGQPVPPEFWTSFLTHAFLHGGLFHLAMNGVLFLGLGGMLANAIGTVRFLTLFAVTAIGGALVFGLLAEAQGPLVGASGALFGFIGALKRWEWRWIRITGASSDKFWRTILALAGLNVVLFYLFPGEGSLAWEAHLGGFITGFLLAPLIAPRFAAPSPI